MRVRETSTQAKRGVSDIWEIRLDKKTKALLRYLGEKRRCTMSWLARYCIFRLVHKNKISKEDFQAIVEDIKANRAPFRELERFYVCFYGEDILWVKMQAAALGVTVSMLIRVALSRYLGTLESERAVPWWRLFWYGIKLNKEVMLERVRAHRAIVQEFLISKSFSPWDYWDLPEGVLPKFLA